MSFYPSVSLSMFFAGVATGTTVGFADCIGSGGGDITVAEWRRHAISVLILRKCLDMRGTIR
jgi:hypothetical protein